MSNPLLSLALKGFRSVASGVRTSGLVGVRTLVTLPKTMAESSAKRSNVSDGPLTVETMNVQMREMQYAVRGKLVIRAGELEKDLSAIKNGTYKDTPKNFDKIVYCNIGNPQSVGQAPLTFVREVLALSLAPSLLSNPAAKALFSEESQQRAAKIVGAAGSLGAYSESKGVKLIRDSVARFIKERDGPGSTCDPEHIFITGGASEGVKLILNMLITSPKDGIMIPIPQYPLYSASITLFGGKEVGYYLDESKGWACNKDAILSSLSEARKNGDNVKAIAVINPGNPTGQVLEESNIRDIIQICEQEKLVLLADEVYQSNVYPKDKKFVSFKKIHQQLGSKVQLVSFHSVSKGMLGECGLRGGYMEVVNFDKALVEQVYKAVSVNLCSNLPGQVAVEVMVNPPTGDAKALWQKEYEGIKNSLATKAQKVVNFLNSLPGMSCNASEGAMYLFPQVKLSAEAIKAANDQGEVPDVFYCMALLNQTGICVVPGSGFRQEQGTWHFRITFLPLEKDIDDMLVRLGKFHNEFVKDPRKFMWEVKKPAV